MIFRQVALERLSSPEQLDQLMQITSPQGWLALTGLWGLLAAALLWGAFGTIPSEVAGEGILLREGGVSALVASTAGQVETVAVRAGDVVERDQVVATLHQEGLQRQLADDRAKVGAAQAEYDRLRRSAEEQRRLRRRGLAQERSNLERTLTTLDQAVHFDELQVAGAMKLWHDGLITLQARVDSEQRLNADRGQLERSRLELHSLELKDLEAQRQLDLPLEAKRSALRDLELQVGEAQARLAESSGVVSPHSGRVVEVLVDRGAVVQPGTPILSIEVAKTDLYVALFVPAADGKRIRPGMKARISPSTVKREQYGALEGTVISTSDFPATPQGMLRLLGNEALVARLTQSGPSIQVTVALQRDRRSASGYRWSSPRGPRVVISSGTLASGTLIVNEDRPLSLVIPTVREKLGV